MKEVKLSCSTAGVLFNVRVSPGARRSVVMGIHGDALKISVSAPPEKGRANEEVLELLAEVLVLPCKNLSVRHGEKSRAKVIEVRAVDAANLALRLKKITEPTS